MTAVHTSVIYAVHYELIKLLHWRAGICITCGSRVVTVINIFPVIEKILVLLNQAFCVLQSTETSPFRIYLEDYIAVHKRPEKTSPFTLCAVFAKEDFIVTFHYNKCNKVVTCGY